MEIYGHCGQSSNFDMSFLNLLCTCKGSKWAFVIKLSKQSKKTIFLVILKHSESNRIILKKKKNIQVVHCRNP